MAERERRQEREDDALVGNASDAAQVREAGRKEKARRARELADLRTVLVSAQGRRLLWRLLEHCGAFASVWPASGPDALTMAYNSGRQDVGHFLLSELDAADPAALGQMASDAKERFPDA